MYLLKVYIQKKKKQNYLTNVTGSLKFATE